MKDKIKAHLENHLKNATVVVEDPKNDGLHLEAKVISEEFEGLSLVEQHRLVMNSLKEQFATDLHALKLKTLTPKQYKQKETN